MDWSLSLISSASSMMTCRTEHMEVSGAGGGRIRQSQQLHSIFITWTNEKQYYYFSSSTPILVTTKHRRTTYTVYFHCYWKIHTQCIYMHTFDYPQVPKILSVITAVTLQREETAHCEQEDDKRKRTRTNKKTQPNSSRLKRQKQKNNQYRWRNVSDLHSMRVLDSHCAWANYL